MKNNKKKFIVEPFLLVEFVLLLATMYVSGSNESQKYTMKIKGYTRDKGNRKYV